MSKPDKLYTTYSTYDVKDVIGEGGSGLIYKAVDDDGLNVAIKALPFEKSSKGKLKRFKNESHFCRNCDHANIVKVTDSGLFDDKKTPFFVMPLYEGSLRKIINKINPEQANGIIAKILDGIEAAHLLGVTHRDIKPENILINGIGTDLVISDFGIAGFREEDLLTAVETGDGARLCNFQYSAPEQKSRGKQVDHRADIYAAGLIINELFTKEIPHGTDYKTINNVAPDFKYLDIVVEKALRQDPNNRYQSIDELKKEISARGKEHISSQKLDRLKKTVIPTTDLDDPIVNAPMKVVGFDWNDSHLRIKVNHVFNKDFIWAMHNLGGYTSILGKDPNCFEYLGDTAAIAAQPNEVQDVINYFKGWLTKASIIYSDKLRKAKFDAENQERERLRKQIAKEEERANLLKNIKF